MPTYQSLCKQYQLDDELMSTMLLFDKLHYLLIEKNVDVDDTMMILSEHHSTVDIFMLVSTVLLKE